MPSTDDVIPFRIAVPDDVLTDLRRRLDDTRWPEAETVGDGTALDWSQGIPLAYTRELARYWASEYDWRAREAALNRFDQFTTEIDGLDVHFIHQRSKHADAMPLVITHGWPGSIVEFAKIIEPLTDPTAHGGRAEDAFHVVCPSLPGYGFGQAGRDGMERRPSRRGVGDVDDQARLRPLRRAGRRLGWRGHRADRTRRRTLRRHPHQLPHRLPTEEAKSNPTDEDEAAFAG